MQDGTGSMLPGYHNAVVSQGNVIYNGLNGSDARILTTGGDQVTTDAFQKAPPEHRGSSC